MKAQQVAPAPDYGPRWQQQSMAASSSSSSKTNVVTTAGTTTTKATTKATNLKKTKTRSSTPTRTIGPVVVTAPFASLPLAGSKDHRGKASSSSLSISSSSLTPDNAKDDDGPNIKKPTTAKANVSEEAASIGSTTDETMMLLLSNNDDSIVDRSTFSRHDMQPLVLVQGTSKTVAWRKLLNCFCSKNQKRFNNDDNNIKTKKGIVAYSNIGGGGGGSSGCGDGNNNKGHPSTTASPAFSGLLPGILRRHDDEDDDELVEPRLSYPPELQHQQQEQPLSSYPHDAKYRSHHHHPDHQHPPPPHGDHDDDAVSDFTESETSSYLSFSNDEEEEDLDRDWKNKESAFRAPHNKKNQNDEAPEASTAASATPVEASAEPAHTTSSPNRPPMISARATTMAATASYDANTSALNLDKTIAKPVALATRSRSTATMATTTASLGLPPLVPSSSGQLDHAASNLSVVGLPRRRTDTGDATFLTRTSTTTNDSRHRRKAQFAFSDDSISEIWKQQWANNDSETDADEEGPTSSSVPPAPPLPPVPPSFVSFHGPPAISSVSALYRRASDVSALAMSSSFGTSGPSFDLDEYQKVLHEDDILDFSADDSSSPFAGLEHKAFGSSGSAATMIPSPRQFLSSKTLENDEPEADQSNEVRCSPATVPENEDSSVISGYLRKNHSLDATTEGQVVLSGWLAALFLKDPTLGMDPEQQVIPDSFPANPDDIFYLRVVVLGDGCARLLLQRSSSGGQVEHSWTVQRNWICLSRDTIDRRKGRCVLIHLQDPTLTSMASTEATMTTPSSLLLLPVSLGRSFYDDDKALVSKTTFCRLQNKLFPTDRAGYAPDEQVDSAMHVLFTIDSIIKKHCVGTPY